MTIGIVVLDEREPFAVAEAGSAGEAVLRRVFRIEQRLGHDPRWVEVKA